MLIAEVDRKRRRIQAVVATSWLRSLRCQESVSASWSSVEFVGDGVEVGPGCGRRGRCLWGSTGGAARWCSRWCRAARGCAGRRSRPACRSSTVNCGVVGHLLALVPGERAAQLFGQRRRSWPRARRATTSAVCRSGRCDEHDEAGLAFDEGPDRRACRLPMIRSPSQCPGTARSATSAGRSLIMDHVAELALPFDRVGPCGRRVAARCAGSRVSSLRSAPRACTNSD